MDALTKAAIDSLIKKVLPQLGEELQNIAHQDLPIQELPKDLRYLLSECQELLGLIQGNFAPSKPSSAKADENMNDEQAQALLQAMEGGEASNDEPDETDLSEEEALRLMAEMEDAAPAASTPPADDMSDEDAQKMLAMMEEETESPPSSENLKATSDMQSDGDEASALQSDSENLVEIEEWETNDFQTDPEMINDFISNADEIMNTLDAAILQLEQNPEDKDIIEEIFRGAHTLKGAGGMFGFKALERVMHRLENLFDLIRKNKLKASSDTVDAVFQGLDLLRELLQAVKEGKPCGAKTVPVVIALEKATRGEPVSRSAKPTAEAMPEKTAAAPTEVVQAKSPGKQTGEKEASSPKKEQSTIRVDLERLDVLVNLVGELVIDRTRFASIEEDLRTNYPQIKLGSSISETVQLFGRHMNEIQDIIMKVRMVPIGNAFNKFSRIVRDLARSLDKKIDLIISGETAELDKTMVEQIGDPLIHLIRNSCDHGIEMPEVRVQSGKSPVGKIHLSAHQEGNHIVITIRDDGKGMSPEQIRLKGIEKGLINHEDTLSDRDIFNLIFEPGFSTAEKVTNISGRGVGMDVVKKQIMKLKGMIEIDSSPGKGTVISIRLPLTLAIVQSLLVKSQQETFAIPLSSVIESIRISPKDIQRVGDAEVYKLRDKVLPLIHLDEALGLNSKRGSIAEMLATARRSDVHHERKSKKQERIFIVVVGHNDRPTGIVVDQLLNQQEMVIKSMGSLMKNIPCVAGGAVLGHGEVVLVLDIPELEHITKSRSRNISTVA
ncbi:MAG: chemotaxis protein CheW [Oligoflexus sp.]